MTDFDALHGLTHEMVRGLLLDSDPYLSCSECFERLDSYVEACVADAQHRDVPMQVHLAACAACADEAAVLHEFVAENQ